MISASPLPPPPDRQPVRRALLSVSDKTGLATFATRLAALGIELLSTGGTARTLREAGLAVTDVSEVTGFPEILGGRVKTLHPKVHGALLARRGHADDDAEMEEHAITPIDLVVVNLYPFEEAAGREDVTDALAAENVDIGGPTMLRAAAKNWFYVGVVTDPAQYAAVADELESHDARLALATRRALARAAFARTAAYDAAIVEYLDREDGPPAGGAGILPDTLDLRLAKAQDLRYGENPHQAAALYGEPQRFIEQLHGKELSFNNLLDLSAALALIREFAHAAPTVAILKHTNPCGVGTADTLLAAYHQAFATDRQSPFGGIVVVNHELDIEAARAIDEVFTEIVIAPAFDEEALDFLRQKQNRRLIRSIRHALPGALDIRSAVGGVLVQQADPPLAPAGGQDVLGGDHLRDHTRVVTRRQPTDDEWADLDFAWRVCKHVKSNAIVYARGGATLGVGAGQMSRIDASEIAVSKAAKSGLTLEHAALASDAFFPFADGLLAAAQAGARAIIQPGGSVRDDEVIAAADEHDLTMVFTGRRHFRH
jgi:phosphoribosylaminoimidazolecarboxamide formyltransferase / IMP cyclohydrolase